MVNPWIAFAFRYILCNDDTWWRINWKHFLRYGPFVRGIHQSPVNSPHNGQWRRALMFYFICARLNGWVNNDEAGDLRRHRAHSDAFVMSTDHIAYENRATQVLIPNACQSNPRSMGTYVSQNNMITSYHGDVFRITGHWCGEITGFPAAMASNADLWWPHCCSIA